MTVVAQCAKVPGMSYYVAGSIPAVTPRYSTKKIEKMLFGAQKNKGKKSLSGENYLFATLGEGLGCVLIKSTLGFRGSPEERDVRNNGEQWGTRGQFTSNLRLRRTTRVTAGGRQVSKGGIIKGKCYEQTVYNPHSCMYE